MLFIKSYAKHEEDSYRYLFEGKTRFLTFQQLIKLVELTQDHEECIKITSESSLVIQNVNKPLVNIQVVSKLTGLGVRLPRKFSHRNAIIQKSDLKFSFEFSSVDQIGEKNRKFFIKLFVEDYSNFLKTNKSLMKTLKLPVSESIINKCFGDGFFKVSKVVSNQKEIQSLIFQNEV